jgi:hypothetical protein
LSDYVIDEGTAKIANTGNLKVVDRRNLDLLQEEQNFQTSGEVSEATVQSIGQKTGAQFIITGTISPIGELYRIRVQAIKVETAEIAGGQSVMVQPDTTLLALLDIKIPDFSTGRRVGAGFLNLAFGAGSFTMGDWLGGALCAAGYASAIGLIVWDIVGFVYEDAMAGVPGTIGFGIAGATAIFGMVRPFFFHRPASGSLAGLFNNMNIALVPDSSGIKAVRMSYTLSF